MIRFFAKNDIITIIGLLLYALIIKSYIIFYPTLFQPNELDSFIGHFLFSFDNDRVILRFVLTTFFVLTQAIQINSIANDSRMFASQSGFAGLFYVLLSSLSPEYMSISPALVGMSFVLLAIQSVYDVYKKSSVTKKIFNASLMIAIATIFYPPYAVMFIGLFIELIILRSFTFKEQLQYLVGFLSLFWITAVVLYYFDTLSFDFINQVSFGGSLSLFVIEDFIDIAGLFLISALVLYVLLSYYGYQKKKEVETRKKIDFLYWIMLLSLIGLLIFKNIQPNFLVLLVMPLSILIAISMSSVKNIRKVEFFHLLLLSLVLFVQYNQLVAVDI